MVLLPIDGSLIAYFGYLVGFDFISGFLFLKIYIKKFAFDLQFS